MPSRWTLPVLATVAVVAIVTPANGASPPRPGIHALPTNLPMLRNAVALGTLVAIDPSARLAEFRIRCGWYITPRHRIRTGLWKVALQGLSFEWESYPDGPASGISHTESLRSWERSAERSGWSGTLHISTSNGFLSNGPTTDICAGVLG